MSTLLIGHNVISPTNILNSLLNAVQEMDFKKVVEMPYRIKIDEVNEKIQQRNINNEKREALVVQRDDLLTDLNKTKVSRQHYLIITIEYILDLANKFNWGICKCHQSIYLYNGMFWSICNKSELILFFSKVCERMGIIWKAKYHVFHEDLYNQFMAVAHLSRPDQLKNTVLINLKNGTYEISPFKQQLRPPERSDFLTYQLSFHYNASLKAPKFHEYLDTVLPDPDSQAILAEYIGYLFIKPNALKLEKALLLFSFLSEALKQYF